MVERQRHCPSTDTRNRSLRCNYFCYPRRSLDKSRHPIPALQNYRSLRQQTRSPQNSHADPRHPMPRLHFLRSMAPFAQRAPDRWGLTVTCHRTGEHEPCDGAPPANREKQILHRPHLPNLRPTVACLTRPVCHAPSVGGKSARARFCEPATRTRCGKSPGAASVIGTLRYAGSSRTQSGLCACPAEMCQAALFLKNCRYSNRPRQV